MEEPVRVDLVFPRSGQRLEVFVPRGVALASEEMQIVPQAVRNTRSRPDVDVQDREGSESVQ